MNRHVVITATPQHSGVECVCERAHTPVGYVNTDDAGLQQFSVLVGARRQQPALVMRQTVADKQDVVLLRGLAKRLAELRLLVLHRSQNEGRRVQTQTLRTLRDG